MSEPTITPDIIRSHGITDEEYQRIIELGATVHEPVQDVGEGIKVATVKDPFGNVFGIIENPNFKLD